MSTCRCTHCKRSVPGVCGARKRVIRRGLPPPPLPSPLSLYADFINRAIIIVMFYTPRSYHSAVGHVRPAVAAFRKSGARIVFTPTSRQPELLSVHFQWKLFRVEIFQAAGRIPPSPLPPPVSRGKTELRKGWDDPSIKIL